MIAELDDERVADKVAKIRFPTPAVCGRMRCAETPSWRPGRSGSLPLMRQTLGG